MPELMRMGKGYWENKWGNLLCKYNKLAYDVMSLT